MQRLLLGGQDYALPTLAAWFDRMVLVRLKRRAEACHLSMLTDLHQTGHCWETPLSSITEPLESRDICWSEFISIEPCHHPDYIDRRSNAKMVQVGFGKTNIAGATHAKGPHAL